MYIYTSSEEVICVIFSAWAWRLAGSFLSLIMRLILLEMRDNFAICCALVVTSALFVMSWMSFMISVIISDSAMRSSFSDDMGTIVS